jgi:hypothetical protein
VAAPTTGGAANGHGGAIHRAKRVNKSAVHTEARARTLQTVEGSPAAGELRVREVKERGFVPVHRFEFIGLDFIL